MKLLLKRDLLNNSYTLGELFIDEVHFCYTVEDTVRELKDINNDGDFSDLNEGKIQDKTAIPSGEYKVILSMSNRFKIMMPEVLAVKGFTGIRIHSGNKSEDSSGCIIVGTVRTPDGVGMSRDCFKRLMIKLASQKDITLKIE